MNFSASGEAHPRNLPCQYRSRDWWNRVPPVHDEPVPAVQRMRGRPVAPCSGIVGSRGIPNSGWTDVFLITCEPSWILEAQGTIATKPVPQYD